VAKPQLEPGGVWSNVEWAGADGWRSHLPDLLALYPGVTEDYIEKVCEALFYCLRVFGCNSARHWMAPGVVARVFSTGGPYEPELSRHFEAVCMFRDGVVAFKVPPCGQDRLDWGDVDDVWDSVCVAAGAWWMSPLGTNRFSEACDDIKAGRVVARLSKHWRSTLRPRTAADFEVLLALAWSLSQRSDMGTAGLGVRQIADQFFEGATMRASRGLGLLVRERVLTVARCHVKPTDGSNGRVTLYDLTMDSSLFTVLRGD